MRLITKAQAIALVGAAEVDRCVQQHDTSLLSTGAKLFVTRVGAVRRFGIYGYAHDGRDLEAALALLA
jgi:hypothetical protein